MDWNEPSIMDRRFLIIKEEEYRIQLINVRADLFMLTKQIQQLEKNESILEGRILSLQEVLMSLPEAENDE